MSAKEQPHAASDFNEIFEMEPDKLPKDNSLETVDDEMSSTASTAVERLAVTFFAQPFAQSWFFRKPDDQAARREGISILVKNL